MTKYPTDYNGPSVSSEQLEKIAIQLQSLAEENIQLKARVKHLEDNL